MKAETNFDCVWGYNRVFGASWNVEMVKCASYRSDDPGDDVAKIEDQCQRPSRLLRQRQ